METGTWRMEGVANSVYSHGRSNSAAPLNQTSYWRKVIQPLTVTLDASSPGVLLPFDVPDVRRIKLLRRDPTGLALPSTGEVAPVL